MSDAPRHVPEIVKVFLEAARMRLEYFVYDRALKLDSYDRARPHDTVWQHTLCGSGCLKNVALILYTDVERAARYEGHITSWLWYGVRERYEWIPYRTRRVTGMDEILRTCNQSLKDLRVASAFCLPIDAKPRPAV